ncbi:hypothetical protein Tco_1532049 [Tanacetum coccineum]
MCGEVCLAPHLPAPSTLKPNTTTLVALIGNLPMTEEDPSEHWDSDLQRDVDNTATTPAPLEPSPYRRLTARIRATDFQQETYPASQIPPLHSSQPASTTYHIGGPSSADPYVTATRASDRYTWQGHTEEYMQATEPRPPMARSSHILLGTPADYISCLNQFEQNRIRNLTKAANTARYRLDLQADTMNEMMGAIHRMDAQMVCMLGDRQEARADSRISSECILALESVRSGYEAGAIGDLQHISPRSLRVLGAFIVESECDCVSGMSDMGLATDIYMRLLITAMATAVSIWLGSWSLRSVSLTISEVQSVTWRGSRDSELRQKKAHDLDSRNWERVHNSVSVGWEIRVISVSRNGYRSKTDGVILVVRLLVRTRRDTVDGGEDVADIDIDLDDEVGGWSGYRCVCMYYILTKYIDGAVTHELCTVIECEVLRWISGLAVLIWFLDDHCDIVSANVRLVVVGCNVLGDLRDEQRSVYNYHGIIRECRDVTRVHIWGDKVDSEYVDTVTLVRQMIESQYSQGVADTYLLDLHFTTVRGRVFVVYVALLVRMTTSRVSWRVDVRVLKIVIEVDMGDRILLIDERDISIESLRGDLGDRVWRIDGSEEDIEIMTREYICILRSVVGGLSLMWIVIERIVDRR